LKTRITGLCTRPVQHDEMGMRVPANRTQVRVFQNDRPADYADAKEG
jgi:hypothetical protein